MSSPFEAEIRALLLRSSQTADQESVVTELARRWSLKLLSESEQSDCAEFFVAIGALPTLFSKIESLSEEQAPIPWAAFAEALGRARIKPNELELNALFEGAKSQGASADLVRSHQLDIWSRRFGEERRVIEKLRAEDLERKKFEIKDRLQFVRAGRLINQEKEVLAEFQALAPHDPEVKKELESYEMRWARDILQRSNTMNEASVEDLARRADRLTPEQEASKALLIARTQEIAKKDPAVAYDLAMNLHFMDFNLEALEILRVAPPSPAVDWLTLELMIQSRRFVDALSQAAHLEAAYAEDPDAAFAVTYARARALKGLGQVELAIDLLRSLIRVRPAYKSAQSLLMDWSGGDE